MLRGLFDIKVKKGIGHNSSLEEELKSNKERLRVKEKELSRYERLTENPIENDVKRKDYRKRIEKNSSDIETLRDVDYVNKRIKEINIDKQILMKSKQSEEKLFTFAISAEKEAKNLKIKANEKYEEYSSDIKKLKSLIDDYKNLKRRNESFLSNFKQSNEQLSKPSREEFEQLKDDLYSLQVSEQKMIGECKEFIHEQIISDEYGIKNEAVSWPELVSTIDLISETFANLESRKNILNKQIREHNETIGNKKEVLIQNYRVIKSFEKDVNDSFKDIEINNVKEVAFSVGINKLYEGLIMNLEKENLYSSRMISDDFFERLVIFSEKFFDSEDNFSITMNKVIESFEPKMQLKHKKSKENKTQSNSTNALIKIKLVQVLLKKLINKSYSTNYPVAFDEIANVDLGQFTWWLNDLKENGFSLLGAGTHSTGSEVISTIGRHHVIDAMKTEYPYNQERTMVYWKKPENIYKSMSSIDQQSLIPQY